jgi:hypothetical protein
MHPCPVCGYLTFNEPPGSYDVCDVCGWEDDALQLEFATTLAGGANALTLADAQVRFTKSRDRLARKHMSSVIPREQDPTWRPIDIVRDRFPSWTADNAERVPHSDDRLYYWRDSFWYRDRG